MTQQTEERYINPFSWTYKPPKTSYSQYRDMLPAGHFTTDDAAKIWGLDHAATHNRLVQMRRHNYLRRISAGKNCGKGGGHIPSTWEVLK